MEKLREFEFVHKTLRLAPYNVYPLRKIDRTCLRLRRVTAVNAK